MITFIVNIYEIIQFFQLYLTTRFLRFIIVYKFICEEFSVKVIITFINIIDVNEMLIEIDDFTQKKFRPIPDSFGQ